MSGLKCFGFAHMPASDKGDDFVIGVDLGGTKILAGIFQSPEHLIAKTKVSTKPGRGAKAVVERLARAIREAADEADVPWKRVRAVGLGAPGAVDRTTGLVLHAPNLEWRDVALKAELERILDLPVFVENDGDLAMLGVHVIEMQSRPRHAVGVFIGTGIGGGLVLEGQLYHGFSHTAGEVGHMVLEVNGPKCACGKQGCFEALASRRAIVERLKGAVKSGESFALAEQIGSNFDDVRSGDLRKAIRRGDEFVQRIVEEAARYTGVAVANLVNLLNPELVVLGGGMIEALEDEVFGIIVKVAREQFLAGTSTKVEIVASKLGDLAGITGGAVLARQMTK